MPENEFQGILHLTSKLLWKKLEKQTPKNTLRKGVFWWNYTTSLEHILNGIPDARAERVATLNEIIRFRRAVLAGDQNFSLPILLKSNLAWLYFSITVVQKDNK